MAQKWDANRHERLLKTLVKNFAIDKAALIKAYNAEWKGTDQFTMRAIEQHITKLNGGGGSKASKKLTALPKTPVKCEYAQSPKTPASKVAVPKTPTSSARKRKKIELSDDEEEAEDEGEESEPDLIGEISNDIPLRQSISRSSKTNNQGSNESDDESDGEGKRDHESAPGSNEDGDMFTYGLNFDGVAERSKPQGMSAAIGNGPNNGVGKTRRSLIKDRLLNFNERNDEDGEWVPGEDW